MGAPELIDSCSYELILITRLLDARQKYRDLDEARKHVPFKDRIIANRKAIDALVTVLDLEKQMEELRYDNH